MRIVSPGRTEFRDVRARGPSVLRMVVGVHQLRERKRKRVMKVSYREDIIIIRGVYLVRKSEKLLKNKTSVSEAEKYLVGKKFANSQENSGNSVRRQ